MKKKLLFPCVLLVLVMILSGAFSVNANTEATVSMTDVYAGTAPEAGVVVTISTEAELDLFADYVAKGNETAGITFRLEADIALTDNPDTPDASSGRDVAAANISTMNSIGGTIIVNPDNNRQNIISPVAFKGVFDGNGKTVSNVAFRDHFLSLDGTTATRVHVGEYNSFFTKLEGATVKDLTISISALRNPGQNEYGFLASVATDSTITGCSVVTSSAGALAVSNKNTVLGGVVGRATNSVVENCVVTLPLKGFKLVAGVVGIADNTAVRNCIVGGSLENARVSNQNGTHVAGVVGQLVNGATVKNCYANVSLTGYGYLAGIAAEIGEGCAVANCASAATFLTDPTSANVKAGGLVAAKNEGTVSNAFGLYAATSNTQKPYDAVPARDNAGAENTGSVEDVYSYTVTAGETVGEYVFTVGAVESVVGEGGATTYEFKAADPAISLADALNAWVAENSTADVTYQAWVQVGDTVTNCFHNTLTLVPYAGQEPTCVQPGLGHYVCSVCGKVMEDMDDVPMEATGVHTAPVGTAVCNDYDCTVCGEHVDATADHRFNPEEKPCEDRTCITCSQVIPAEVPHTKPADYDETKNCKSYECTECHAIVAGEGVHSFGSDIKACQDATCSVCGETVEATAAHRAGPAATCNRAQVCIVCRTEIKPKLEHISDGIANCGKPEQCVLCSAALGDPVGEHVPNKDHATCNGGVVCLVCGNELEAQLTHAPKPGITIDCGHGQICVHCNVVLEQATGAHTPDWSTATVVREATADRTGIVVAKCSTCGKDVERYTTLSAFDADGKVALSGNAALVVGSRVDVAFGKVADVATLTLDDGFVPLQVLTFKLLDADGKEIALSGNATVKMILNVSVAKMAKEHLKLYKVDGTTVSEVTISELADGYLTFSASATGTYLIAGTKTVAMEVIGSYIPEATPGETAALIGTPDYEKKDEEI
ncbi:MAG: hypothetical protein IJV96_04435 [Clostridia bacterium]|nr:hypothetical protein [Clostridia bacterium]